jgi:hypothetical protein
LLRDVGNSQPVAIFVSERIAEDLVQLERRTRNSFRQVVGRGGKRSLPVELQRAATAAGQRAEIA